MEVDEAVASQVWRCLAIATRRLFECIYPKIGIAVAIVPCKKYYLRISHDTVRNLTTVLPQ